MPDYQLAKIYKLLSNHTDQVYIGSTCQSLAKRKGGHIAAFKLYLKGPKRPCMSYKLIELGDIDIVLIEECPCDNKEQLHARERFYIESNDCVNKMIPGRTQKEYQEENKEKKKENYQLNKDKIKENQKEQYQLNKDKIKEQYQLNKDKIKEKMKEYYQLNKEKMKEQYQNNKEIIKEQNKNNKDKIKEQYQLNKDKIKDKIKEYQENNKEKLTEKFDCECGGKYTFQNKSTHFKTKRHTDHISTTSSSSD